MCLFNTMASLGCKHDWFHLNVCSIVSVGICHNRSLWHCMCESLSLWTCSPFVAINVFVF